MKLYVGTALQHDRRRSLDLFSQHGTVQSVQIIIDRDTGRSKASGFVEMEAAMKPRRPSRPSTPREINGRKLTVNEARPREERGRAVVAAGAVVAVEAVTAAAVAAIGTKPTIPSLLTRGFFPLVPGLPGPHCVSPRVKSARLTSARRSSCAGSSGG